MWPFQCHLKMSYLEQDLFVYHLQVRELPVINIIIIIIIVIIIIIIIIVLT